MAAATRFRALMVRVGYGVDPAAFGDYGWILDLLGITPQAGTALVFVGTTDATRPPITRVFAFGGAGVHGATGLDKQLAVSDDATSARPLHLATSDPGDALAPSDFDSQLRSPAELVVAGPHSSAEQLRVGGGHLRDVGPVPG